MAFNFSVAFLVEDYSDSAFLGSLESFVLKSILENMVFLAPNWDDLCANMKLIDYFGRSKLCFWAIITAMLLRLVPY